jgi:hypothetical protein
MRVYCPNQSKPRATRPSTQPLQNHRHIVTEEMARVPVLLLALAQSLTVSPRPARETQRVTLNRCALR